MFRRKINAIVAPLLHQSWLVYGLLFLITVFAAALRFYKLGDWSFWIDEIYTINHAIAHFSSLELIREHIPPARNWIPVSTIFTAQILKTWGVNEWNARFIPAVIGIMSIPILFVPVKKMFGSRVALIAMLLLVISPWHVFWSQNARFYTSLLLFYTLALFVFYYAIEKDRPFYLVVFYFLFYLSMSERMIAVLLFPVIAIYLLFLLIFPFERPRGFNVRNILILAAPILLFLLAQIILFVSTGTFMFAFDLDALAPPIDSPIRLLIVIAFSIGIPLLSLAFFSGVHLIMQKDRAGLFIFIAALLPPLMIALASPFFFIVDRYAFISLLFWLILAAVGMTTIFKMIDRRGIALAFGIFMILIADAAGANLMYYQINRGDRLNWREMVGFIKENKQAGDLVVSTRSELASYYLDEDVVEYQNTHPEDYEGTDSTIWFIIDYPGVWHGSQSSKTWMEKNAELLKYSYLRVREENSLLVYRFKPNDNSLP
jgi:mannosyltransferase